MIQLENISNFDSLCYPSWLDQCSVKSFLNLSLLSVNTALSVNIEHELESSKTLDLHCVSL